MIPELDVAGIGSLNDDWLEVISSANNLANVQLEKKIGFRPTIDLRSKPIDEIRAITAKGAAATDAQFPPPVVEGLVSEDRQIDTINNDKIDIRIYTLEKLKGKKSPVVVL